MHNRPALLTFFIILDATVLSSLGIIFPIVWPLAPLGLGLFFLGLTRIEKLRAVVASGLLYGFVTGCAGIIWFWDTLPLDWLFIHDPTVQVLSVAMTWAYISLALSTAVAIGSLPLWYVLRLPYWFLYVPFVWVAIEEGRSWMFAVFTYAPQSLFGAHFSPASIGYPLTEASYLLQFAYPFGMYGLSYVAALGAAVAVFSFTTSSKRARIMSVVLLAVVLLLPLVIRPTPIATTKEMKIALLSTTVQAGTNEGADTARLLLEQTLATNPDLLVMPEAVNLTELYGEGFKASTLLENHPDTMLVHTLYQDRSGTLVYETTEGVAATYRKMFLMPLGEYAPSFSGIFYNGIKDESLKTHINTLRFYYERGTTTTAIKYNGAVIGSLLCSEMLSPHLYSDLVTTYNPNILINLSNNSWFHESKVLHDKLLQVAKTQAVAHQRYLLVATNESPAYAIAPNGSVMAMTAWGTPEALFLDIPY